MKAINFHLRNMEAMMKSHKNEMHGLVTSYDEKKHLAKVTYQPGGETSGWLPIEESHMGNGWGMLVGLTPGSGQGSGQGGAGSGGSSGGSGGGSGGSGGSGGGQQNQYQGDQVIIRYQEGNLNSGKIVKRLHSKVDAPPKVKAGEMLMMHSLGGRMFFDEKGQFHLYDKTSNQDSQSQSSQSGQGAQGGAGGSGGGSGGGGGGGPTPLKNAPPLEPASWHFTTDGKGKSTMTHFQQDQRQQGQDPTDPNSQKSPKPYAKRGVSGKDMTHDAVTYQQEQGGQQGGQGQQGGGGQAQPATNQGDPGKAASTQAGKMHTRTFSDSKKGTHETQIYQKGSDNMAHQVKFDREAGTATWTTFEKGSDKAQHTFTTDSNKKTACIKTFQGGQEMSSTTWDTQGNIGHKSKGVHSVNAQRMHINCDTHVQGGVNAAGTVTSATGIGAPTVSGSPGSVTGISGGGKSPLE